VFFVLTNALDLAKRKGEVTIVELASRFYIILSNTYFRCCRRNWYVLAIGTNRLK
jgi:hypothetical protein